MALRAGYYGIKRFLRNKLETIAGTYDVTINSLFPRSEQSILGADNLLPYPYYQTTRTENGITFTDNGDGTVTANGTATAAVWFAMLIKTYNNASELYKKGQKYILTGCPKGGSNETYRIRFNCNPYSNIHDDYGDGVEFIYPDDDTLTNVYIMIGISNGVTVNNLVFKPMLSLNGGSYVPFAMTNKQLTNSVSDQKTAINAIISAATGAADFAAFKTAMGAITPVTRSYHIEGTTEPDSRSIEEPVVEKKTTTRKKSTAKAETTEEV